MIDMNNVIKGLECCMKESEWYREPCGECSYGAKGGGCIDQLLVDALAMLKEQDETIKELQNAYGYLQKQFFEAQDELLKEQEYVVRCKDCRYYNAEDHDCNITSGYFHVEGDWYCADGERKESL